ncbi:MAG: hypothetical protein ACJ75J_16225 [Cytophagaceae bacterium]
MNFRRLGYFLVAILSLLFFRCEEKKPVPVQQAKKQEMPKPAWKPKFYGEPDTPASDSSITSAGMGKVMLGGKLDSLDVLYDTIHAFSHTIDGLEWPARKISRGKNEWIIASASSAIGRINSVRTNSKRMRSENGNRAGMMVSEITGKDSIGIDQEERAFIIYPERIEFRIESEQEKNFFRSKKPDIRNLNPKAVIREIFIRCGDC